ncbi:DUF2510 domain-containing protein [Rhizohabitans arisaemae]|uniref:DUF2510 domain-containing protein n=1 Tax=Rhizohabitans arisaemae TaxID=2720610 RepID=UPI0024B148E1|nr:DUF2510 domain-containing protein [Rhizohabitans arisaemae]
MTTQTPPGWHPDPYGVPGLLRWWDGNQWTEATHPVEPTTPAGPQAQPPQPSWGAPAPQGQSPSGPGQPPSWQGGAAHSAPGQGAGQWGYGQGPPQGPGGWQGQASSPAQPGPQWGAGEAWRGDTSVMPNQPGGKSLLPWIIGGSAAVAVVVVVVLIISLTGTSTPTEPNALPPAVTVTPTPEAPPTTEPPTTPPTTIPPDLPTGGALPRPVDGKIVDPQAGLSYTFLTDGWRIPNSDEVNSDNPQEQGWTAGFQKVSHEGYKGQNDWIGNAYSGPLARRISYGGPDDLKASARSLLSYFNRNYYPEKHEAEGVEDKAIKVGGRDGWLVKAKLTFNEAKAKRWKWSTETLAIVVVDRGAGQRPGVLYISMPDNLGTANVDRILGSLAVAP